MLWKILKYKQILPNLGLRGDAGGTVEWIANHITCGDEEIIHLLVIRALGNKLEIKYNNPKLD